MKFKYLYTKKIIAYTSMLMIVASLTACSGQSSNTVTETPSGTLQDSSTNSSSTSSSETAVDYSSMIKGSEISVTYDSNELEDDVSTMTYEKVGLNGDSISFSGTGATVDGSNITITKAGTYYFSGTLNDGQIIVDTADDKLVHIIFDNVNITSKTSSPVYVKQCSKKTILTMAAGSTNVVSDAETYVYPDATTDEPSAAIYSKDDLVINGSGSLTVNGNYKNGITSKDDLRIINGNITVNAVKNGIVGKDQLVIKDGTFHITAGADGLKSNNDTDTQKGYILIENGTFQITSGEDGIQTETSLAIRDGNINIVTGGGSANAAAHTNEQPMGGGGGNRPQGGKFQDNTNTTTPSTNTMDNTSSTTQAMTTSAVAPVTNAVSSSTTSSTEETASMKGLKAGNDLYVTGGTFTIDSEDDSLHTNNTIEVKDGTFTLASGDDGIHADSALTIDGGTIKITTCYEGLEATNIAINGGDIDLVASDDGVNASGNSSTAILTMNGGTLHVNASGDGLDSNGSIVMTGGTITVDGPTSGGDGSLDYDGTFAISGGTLIAAGSQGMAQTTSTTSTQASILVTYSSAQAANTTVTLKDSKGTEICTYTPSKQYQTVVLSSPGIKSGETYQLFSGTTKLTDITTSSSVTSVSDTGETVNVSGGFGGGGQMGGQNKGEMGQMPNGEQPTGERPDGTQGQMGGKGERPTAPNGTDATSGATSGGASGDASGAAPGTTQSK